MSELKYMSLSLDETLKNLNNCRNVVLNQKESIIQFRDIILTASNKRSTNERKTTIFLAGAGRSGFVAKAFAMRLMHLGFYVYVFNESIAPPVNDGDIIIIVSKSGKSNSITQIVDNSNFEDVKLLTVCGNTDSDLAKNADARIVVESLPQQVQNLENYEIEEFVENFESENKFKLDSGDLPKKSIDLNDEKNRTFIENLPYKIGNTYLPLELILMGTAFEISALVLLDSLVVELMQKLNLREKDLKEYHDVLSSSI